MKLLYITPFVEGAGGLQRILAIKTSYLTEKWNYDIHILSTNSGTKNPHFNFSPTVKLYSEMAKGSHFQLLYNYSKIINKYINIVNPDIVIVCDNGFKGYCVPFFVRNRKILFESHGSKYVCLKNENFLERISSQIKFKFYNFCISKYDKCIVLGKELAREFSSKNIDIIPNPIWFQNENIAAKKSKTVIAVGRHSYEKGLDKMLLIWQKVVTKYPDWTLEIYGDTDEKYNIKLMAQELMINENVIFFEPVKNIINRYLQASLCILTSRYEGFGMVLIEAMALGLPCVAYDCKCGPKEIILNNENGFLIENDNSEKFINAIFQLIENESLRNDMGIKAKRTAQNYNIDKIMAKWNILFLSLQDN